MIECTSCSREFNSDDIRWFGDDPYCDDCFFDRYTYCSSCDEPVSRDYCSYNGDDDPICDDCYDDDIDYNAPDNPDISDSERKQIVSLCKCWLKGERPKSLIRLNKNDFYLSEIQTGAGLVEQALYLYGLVDRDDFQIKASPNILPKVKKYISQNNIEAIIKEDRGHSRLGVSKQLREESPNKIIELIKSIH
ncbi:MAG: hypothetical protein ACTSYA_08410 [Candidatus Kariarchaeaceae archaeon]